MLSPQITRALMPARLWLGSTLYASAPDKRVRAQVVRTRALSSPPLFLQIRSSAGTEAPEVGKNQLIYEGGMPSHQVKQLARRRGQHEGHGMRGDAVQRPGQHAHALARGRSAGVTALSHGGEVQKSASFFRDTDQRGRLIHAGNTFSTIAPPSSSTKAGRTPGVPSSCTMAGASPP